MTFELLAAFFLLLLIVSFFAVIHFVISIVRVKRKYSHIPGPTQSGITGFFLGDIPTILKQDCMGITLHQYLASL